MCKTRIESLDCPQPPSSHQGGSVIQARYCQSMPIVGINHRYTLEQLALLHFSRVSEMLALNIIFSPHLKKSSDLYFKEGERGKKES